MKPFRHISFERKSFVRKAFQITLLSSIFFASPFIAAGTLSVAQQGNREVATPKNGQDKVRVEAEYGAPLEKISAVGEPPISKWVYQEFTVYFEYDLVLHAVLHQ